MQLPFFILLKSGNMITDNSNGRLSETKTFAIKQNLLEKSLFPLVCFNEESMFDCHLSFRREIMAGIYQKLKSVFYLLLLRALFQFPVLGIDKSATDQSS